MNAPQFAIVIVRLAAIWLVVQTIQYFHQLVRYPVYFESPPPEAEQFIGYIACLLPLIFAAFMWVFPAHVAKVMVARDDRDSDSVVESGKALHVGVALIGLYIFLYGVLDLLFFGTMTFLQRRELGVLAQETEAGLVVSGVQIIVAILLLLGRATLAKVLLRLRNPS